MFDRLRSLAFVGALLLAGVAQGEDPPDPVLAEMGASEFQRYCASCHGADARGRGPVAGALRKTPADLTQIAARRGGRFPAGEIAKFIDGRFDLSAHGSREMPVWGTRFAADLPEAGLGESISRGKIAVLVEYLKTIQTDETDGMEEVDGR